jgi:hypothetical protein
MNDLDRKRLATATKRLADVEQARNMRRAEFEIALAALIAVEREHEIVLEKINSIKRCVAL